MNNNPFTLTFGKEPAMSISRPVQKQIIIDNINANIPSSNVYMITGVRGSGKTVMLTDIQKEVSKDKSWVVIELSPERDMLQALAAKLYSDSTIKSLLVKAKIDLSFFGFGVSIEKDNQITDIEVALDKIIEKVTSSEKKILILVDEVTNNNYVKTFASVFQMLLRHDYPIFMIMTGLYNNISELQNSKSLTFLYRTPKIELEPLNKTAIKNRYKEIFDLEEETALQMADMTKGYPFAFQVLGYLFWNDSKRKLQNIINEYDQYLEEFVYKKIWSELSEKDKELAIGISKYQEPVKIRDIILTLGWNNSTMSLYKDRLKKKGILDTSTYGYVSFTLPRFEKFINSNS